MKENYLFLREIFEIDLVLGQLQLEHLQFQMLSSYQVHTTPEFI